MKWLFKDRSEVIGISFLVGVFLALGGLRAHAGDDGHYHHHAPPKPPTVIVERHDHSGLYALVGAGITYWIMRRRARKHSEADIKLCLSQAVRMQHKLERLEQECVAK